MESKGYYQSLLATDQAVYRDKCGHIDNIDPYLIEKRKLSSDPERLPAVSHNDIVHYLVFSPNPLYTMDEMRAYNGLDAHNQFTSGWVRDISVAYIKEIAVIRGKVMHSQSVRQTLTHPWILVEKNGTVLSANCDCKAGLGSTCTHVAAVLFKVEATIRIRESRTMTQDKAYWLLPQIVRDVPYAPICDIEFTSAKTKRNQLDEAIDNLSQPKDSSTPKNRPRPVRKFQKLSEEEKLCFLSSLLALGSKDALLTVTDPFQEHVIPRTTQPEYPSPLCNLVTEECCEMNRLELLDHCRDVNIAYTKEHTVWIANETTAQSQSKLSIVTASHMKSMCRNSVEKPSASLVRSICYPEEVRFSSAATSWGCTHEKEALGDYKEYAMKKHAKVVLESSGLVINLSFPEIGASPDALISCDCCGNGVCEVKCPYCSSDPEAHNCLKDTDNGVKVLDISHAYCYQVQTQLFVTGRSYTDFVIWCDGRLFTQIILPDTEFRADTYQKAKCFFHEVVLLELCGRYFTRRDKTTFSPIKGTTTISQDRDTWCLCEGPVIPPMVACDSDLCPTERFHLKCLGLKNKPRGKWLCPNCRKKKPRKRKLTL